jgi:hypothetical protein
MKKVLRLTESDLVRLVKKVISEQQTISNEQKMIDTWNKIIVPKLESNGFKLEGGNPQFDKKMTKKNNSGGYTHCVLLWRGKGIFNSTEKGSFISYNAANKYDVPRQGSSMEFEIPKCGTIEVCANRAVISAIKMSSQ